MPPEGRKSCGTTVCKVTWWSLIGLDISIIFQNGKVLLSTTPADSGTSSLARKSLLTHATRQSCWILFRAPRTVIDGSGHSNASRPPLSVFSECAAPMHRPLRNLSRGYWLARAGRASFGAPEPHTQAVRGTRATRASNSAVSWRGIRRGAFPPRLRCAQSPSRGWVVPER